MSRVFKYNGEAYEDPGPEYTPEEIRSHLATIYPEVAQAEIQEKTLEDGTVEVTFVKRAGTKG
jgi:PRTRC genetic system protein C